MTLAGDMAKANAAEWRARQADRPVKPAFHADIWISGPRRLPHCCADVKRGDPIVAEKMPNSVAWLIHSWPCEARAGLGARR